MTTRITYISDQPVDYSHGIRAAESLDELRAFVETWKDLCPDAFEIVQKMDYQGYAEFQKGWKKEKRNVYAGDEWSEKYSFVIMPDVMFRVSIIAEQFKVPWGLAFIRCREEKLIRRVKGHYRFPA